MLFVKNYLKGTETLTYALKVSIKSLQITIYTLFLPRFKEKETNSSSQAYMIKFAENNVQYFSN